MEGLNLISTFAEFKELKNIDRPTMMSVLEDVFRTQLAKMYGTADNFDIIINIDKGDFEIWKNRTVVETVEDPNTQISLEEVKKIDDSYEIGEEFAEEVKLSSFGRKPVGKNHGYRKSESVQYLSGQNRRDSGGRSLSGLEKRGAGHG